MIAVVALSLVDVPLPGGSAILAVAVVFMLLFLTAIGIEVARRAGNRRAIVREAWRSVEAIMEEKDMTEPEEQVLRGVLTRHANTAPHHAVTIRHNFDACVEAEMTRLESGDRPEVFAETGALLRDVRTKLGLDFVALGQRIHSTRELYRTQELWMSPSSAVPSQWLRGSVASVNEAYFSVTPMLGEGEQQPAMRAGERVKCRLWREEDARYMFTVRFSHVTADPPLLYFFHSSDLRRVQNRQHFRIGYDQMADIGVLGQYAEEAPEDGGGKRIVRKVRGRIVNISAGGCAIILGEEISVQHTVRVPLELEGTPPFTVDGDIVSTVPLAAGRFLIRTRFEHIDDETRDQIAQFTIRRQQRVLEQAEKSVV